MAESVVPNEIKKYKPRQIRADVLCHKSVWVLGVYSLCYSNQGSLFMATLEDKKRSLNVKSG